MKELIKCSGGMAGIAGDQASMLSWKNHTGREGGRERGREGEEVRVHELKTSDYLFCLYRALVYHCTMQN